MSMMSCESLLAPLSGANGQQIKFTAGVSGSNTGYLANSTDLDGAPVYGSIKQGQNHLAYHRLYRCTISSGTLIISMNIAEKNQVSEAAGYDRWRYKNAKLEGLGVSIDLDLQQRVISYSNFTGSTWVYDQWAYANSYPNMTNGEEYVLTLTPMNNAQHFWIQVGNDGDRYGWSLATPTFGLITQHFTIEPTLQSNTVHEPADWVYDIFDRGAQMQIVWWDSSSEFIFVAVSGINRENGGWETLDINGNTFLRADAGFNPTATGGRTSWGWTGVTSNPFPAVGQECLIQFI